MIVFLDIDGVLIHKHKSFDPACVAALDSLCTRTKADIVLSTAWRLLYTLEELKYIFHTAGIDAKIIDKTPMIIHRGDEILRWIRDTSYTGDFIIIDDDIDDIVIYEDIPRRCIMHIKDGWTKGGLTQEKVDKFLKYRDKISEAETGAGYCT